MVKVIREEERHRSLIDAARFVGYSSLTPILLFASIDTREYRSFLATTPRAIQSRKQSRVVVLMVDDIQCRATENER